jgi:hypothetical protein
VEEGDSKENSDTMLTWEIVKDIDLSTEVCLGEGFKVGTALGVLVGV